MYTKTGRCNVIMYTTKKRNEYSLSDLVHLGRIVLFFSENFGIRIVPEVLHTWVMDHS